MCRGGGPQSPGQFPRSSLLETIACARVSTQSRLPSAKRDFQSSPWRFPSTLPSLCLMPRPPSESELALTSRLPVPSGRLAFSSATLKRGGLRVTPFSLLCPPRSLAPAAAATTCFLIQTYNKPPPAALRQKDKPGVDCTGRDSQPALLRRDRSVGRLQLPRSDN